MTSWKSHLQTGLSVLKAGAFFGLAAAACGDLAVSRVMAEEAVFSDKARFRIPYQLDSAEIQRLRASEIQLHVSTDQGKSWRHVDSVPPVAGKFTFEAAHDGEYWFSVRTVSDNGQHHPAGALAAGLKVHVDTVLPTLTLQLSEAEPGRVGLQWTAADGHLDLSSLTLESRNADSEAWEAIQIVPTDAGETSWSVPTGSIVSVRGRILDLAGNQVVQQTELSTSAARPQPAPAASQSRRPIATSQPGATPDGTRDPFAQATTQTSPPAKPASTGSLPLISPNGGDYSQLVSQQEPTTPPQQSVDDNQTEQELDTPRQALNPNPPTSQVPAQTPAQVAAAAPIPTAPIRRVNSTNFKIGYALDDVGPSGVSSVDLFLTENNGRDWFHYGADDDGSSPFEVNVPQDGTYGFAIRVRSGVGLAQSPPQPGDPAEVMIAVDRQPPQVTLMPLKQGSGQRPSQLLIEWTMSDEELADRPVSLYFASRPSGPWQPITGWEPNTGQYLWNFGPDVPRQVYIRLEARDTAGNIARVDTPDPLLIDLSRPTARIIDVESISSR